MIFYQTPCPEYPGSVRMVSHLSQSNSDRVLDWLNATVKGRFVAFVEPASFYEDRWMTLFFKDKSAAMLFKLTWSVVST